MLANVGSVGIIRPCEALRPYRVSNECLTHYTTLSCVKCCHVSLSSDKSVNVHVQKSVWKSKFCVFLSFDLNIHVVLCATKVIVTKGSVATRHVSS